ncbi:MAG: hypothetical protein KA792_04200 [Bacteroidales bacterium]|nr:hypothetical protein [Bacteroidales bacterium]
MTKKRIIFGLIAIAAIIVLIYLVPKFISTKKKQDNSIFKDYISAYTAGYISSEAAIKVQLAMDYADTTMFNKAVDETLFEFSPSIKGKAYWIDARTVKFQPEGKLQQDKKYEVKFRLNKIINVPDSLSTLNFDFRVIKQAFELNIDNIKPYDKLNYNWVKITGTVKTADIADADEFEGFLEAFQNSQQLKVKWLSDADRKVHHFTIDSASRKNKEQEVVLQWKASKIGAERREDDKLTIPAIDVFKVTKVSVIQFPDQYILIQFSDPLLEGQNFEGLVRVDKSGNDTESSYRPIEDLKYFTEDNEIRIYLQTTQKGKATVTVENIRNTNNKNLAGKNVNLVVFEGYKPEIRFIGKGNIMPSSNGLILPFEAVNLYAVDLKILKIYENNITQFLQVNDLAGNDQLSRVGQVITKKRILLNNNNVVDFAKWNKFTLDLAEYIKAEQGAIYRISLSFIKEYSLYSCNGVTPNPDNLLQIQNNKDEENDNNNDWDYYSDYEYDYYEGYDYEWSERDNPCNTSYYYNKTISQNILSSDIGLIAKKGENGSYNFFATDIVTTRPLSDITIELYNYQRQLLTTLKTDNEGKAFANLKKTPYLLVAKKGKQRGYLKLDGASLSLSMFDVSGESVQKGIKGFIYGERGVWRPGDSIYLTFILEDKNNSLPDKHPVSFDLINPQGQVIKHILKTNSVNKIYNFSTITDYNAPTGNWTARVKAGSAIFNKTIKIETVMPNRLKINLDFGKTQLFKGSSNTARLSARWLHGAIAKNLKTDVEVTLSQTITQFSKFPNYIFDDPSRNFSSETNTIFSGKLDEQGNASFDTEFSALNTAPGVLKASFVTRVFEGGGAFSIDRQSLFYFPFNYFAGIKFPENKNNSIFYETNKTYNVNIVSVDPYGNLCSQDRTLKVEVYKVSWHWWWDNENDQLSQYEIGSYNKAIQSAEITTKQGKAIFPFFIPYPDWGRFFIKVTDIKSEHSTGQIIYLDWPGYGGRSHGDKADAVTMLSFTADKDKYKVGEKVKLNIPSGPEGRALVSIETGSRVFKTYWVKTSKDFTEFSFEITEEMAPNIYVFVTLLQPHSQTKNDLPIRLYGILPINIEDPNTHLRPSIIMPSTLKPEQKANISIKEENKKEMSYTLAIVDEGLLDLTRFKTPDPWSVFYAREALGVKTWDLYDYVIGAYGGELEKMLSIGGDGDIDRNKAAKNANRFKPMVKFLGPFHLKKGAVNTHSFIMPQYVGSVRVMVIAAYKGAYGNAEKTATVKKPLMLLATLPRVIGPGETFKLPVDVFVMENNIKNVNVTITTNSLLKINPSAKGNGNIKTISFNKPGDNIVDFNIKTNKTVGIGKINITAVSGTETAKYSVEINVRNPNPKVTNISEYVINEGETKDASFILPGLEGTNKGVLEVSTVFPLNLEKRLRYLIDYPHGCAEQISSQAFAQLYLTDFVDLPEYIKNRIETSVKYTISRLQAYQVAEGGFGFWPGYLDTDFWLTNYAGHFLLEAANKGYSVSPTMLDKWKKYQKDKANQWTHSKNYYYNDDYAQAYRLYTLALAKAPEAGAMNRLRELPNLTQNAKWRLAAAYQMAGYYDIATKLIKGLSYEVQPYKEQNYTYGSEDRDLAMYLETLILMNRKTEAFKIARNISAALCQKGWMSTQTTAYCLLAMSKYYKTTSKTADVNFIYSLNNGKQIIVNSPKLFTQNILEVKNSTGAGKLTINNRGKGTLYIRIITEGIPEYGDKSAVANNLKLDIIYKTTSGVVIDPATIQQGTDFIAEATVINPGIYNRQQLALSMVFPSGWEIRNTRMDETESTVISSQFTYQDFRDDRVYTYFDLNRNSSKTFKIQLNASYVGEFYLPTLQVEAMYDATISARISGKWVKVVK